MEERFFLNRFPGIDDPSELPEYIRKHAHELISSSRPFADYMRAKFREKGVLQQNVFLAADLSENYGYKLIAEEKHTVDRDVILRICFAARFNIVETQEALILYGMAPLYERLPRDIVLITAFCHDVYDFEKINNLLLSCGQRALTENTA